MECLGKKRKGAEISSECQKKVDKLTSLAIAWSHLSLEDYSRKKKKCRELGTTKNVDSGRSVVTGVVTAPPCGSACLHSPTRGLKRKIGCIDVATRLGRKKKIEQYYEMSESLGQGKFGSVVLCRTKASGEEFACKTLRKGEEIVHREVEIMQHLSGHPGVVTLKEVYEDAESFYLVMELCSGGRLLDQIAREGECSEQKAAKIIKELMMAIRYCHEMGVVHRDIKPENVLLTNSGQMKLADFGLAVRIVDGQKLTGIVGSPAYVAPEVLAGNYSEKVDIWSAGVLLHRLLVGVLPFRGDSLESVFDAIKKDTLDFTSGVWESVSKPARDLLASMLTRNTSARFTASEVLRHPWISFYTEPALKTISHKAKTKNHAKMALTQLTVLTGPVSKRNESSTSYTLNEDSGPISPSGNSTEALGREADVVDVLTVALSHVRISEPKRSRLCSPARQIEQECSSNLKSTNLCTAF